MSDQTRVPQVFVVDDEQVIASTLSIILRQAGYEATAFFDPGTVLSAVEQTQPDLVISDIVMPQMTGIEMAVQLRNRHPTLRTVLFSGQAATSLLLEEARKQGHTFEVLTKPLHPKDLLSYIDKILKGDQPTSASL